jgi:hypothetical protein
MGFYNMTMDEEAQRICTLSSYLGASTNLPDFKWAWSIVPDVFQEKMHTFDA